MSEISEQPTSRELPRESPETKKLRDSFLDLVLENQPLNTALAGWLMVIAVDYDDPKQLKDSLSSFRVLKEMRTSFNAIDDYLDNQSHEQLMAKEVSLGSKPSPMLQEVMAVPGENLFQKLVDSGLITMPELMAFGNLLCHSLKEEARQGYLFLQNHDVSHRLKMAELHLQVDCIYFGLIAHFFKKNPLITAAVENLSFEDLKEAYPRVIMAARAEQILDDLKDWIVDFKEEEPGIKVSPNFFLAQMEDAGIKPSEVIPQLKKKRRTLFRDLPIDLRNLFKDLKKDFKQEYPQLPIYTRMTFDLFWDTVLKIGFSTK